MSKAQWYIPHHLRKAWVTVHTDWKDLLYQVCLNLKAARGSHLSRGERLQLHLLGILRCLCLSKCTYIHLLFSSLCSACVFVYVSACDWELKCEITACIESRHHVSSTCCQVVTGTHTTFICRRSSKASGQGENYSERDVAIDHTGQERCGQIFKIWTFLFLTNSVKSAWFKVMKSDIATLNFLAMIELTVDLTYC